MVKAARQLDFSDQRVAQMGSKMVTMTTRAALAATVFAVCEKVVLAISGASLHSDSKYEAPLAMAVLIVCVLRWGWLHYQQHTARRPPISDTAGEELPNDHPYYTAIDRARKRFANTCYDAATTKAIAAEREDRLRAKLRSHDPRRWRLSPARFGDGEDATFDFDLFEWSAAERVLALLGTQDSPEAGGAYLGAIQKPPLAYSNELACRAAIATGCTWYFSIFDFESALLDGVLTLHPTQREMGHKRITIDLHLEQAVVTSVPSRDPTAFAAAKTTSCASPDKTSIHCQPDPKPDYRREESPSSIIDQPV